MDFTDKQMKIFEARIREKIEKAIEKYCPQETDFLNLEQLSIAKRVAGEYNDPTIGIFFLGGYKESERKIMAIVPDYMDVESLKPIKAIRATCSEKGKKLKHGDYLGALLGLGIERQVVGDIIVYENGADIIILSDMCRYVLDNFQKAGRTSLDLKEIDIEDIRSNNISGEVVVDTVASLRLDTVIASAFKLSRGKASEAIGRGLVFVNDRECLKGDYQIREGSKLTLRGKGRARLLSVDGETRKGRMRISLELWRNK